MKRATGGFGAVRFGFRGGVAGLAAGSTKYEVQSTKDALRACGRVVVRAATVDEGARTVEAVMTTDAATQVFDWETYRIIDEVLVMEGCVVPGQVPLLNSHSRWSVEDVIGSCRSIRAEEHQLIGVLHFADGDEIALSAFRKIKDGHITDVSVGYMVREWVDIPAGQTQEVNGKKYTAKARALRVSTKWEPFELSVVPIGADSAAKVRERARGNEPMNKRLRKLLEGFGLRGNATVEEAWRFFDGLNGAQRSAAEEVKAAVEGERSDADPGSPEASARANADEHGQTRAAARGAVEAIEPVAGRTLTAVQEIDSQAIVSAERARVRAIRGAALEDTSADLIERAIDGGWSVEQFQGEMLRELRESRATAVGRANGPGPEVYATGDGRDEMRRDLSAAIAMGRGLPVADERQRERSQPYVGIGFRDLARMCVEREGVRGYMTPDQLFERSISTVSLPNILGDSAHRVLTAAYEEAAETYQAWCGEAQVSDFKVHNVLRMSEFNSLTEIGDAGEFDYDTLAEAKETMQVKTYGKAFGITRKQFINDDLGAFLRVPEFLGRGCRRNIADQVYALLISNSGVGPTMGEDAKALFATDHRKVVGKTTTIANYVTGTPGSTLGDDGLQAAKKTLRLITDERGNVLNLTGKVLLVPAALEFTAQKLIESSTIMGWGGNTSTTAPTTNIHRGTLQPVVEARLDAGTNGTTAWYVICDPRRMPLINVVYLAGNRTPVLQRKDPEKVLGLGWRIYHDIAAAAENWRGGVRMKGA